MDDNKTHPAIMTTKFPRLLLYMAGGMAIGFLTPTRWFLYVLTAAFIYGMYLTVQLERSRRRLEREMAELAKLMKDYER